MIDKLGIFAELEPTRQPSCIPTEQPSTWPAMFFYTVTSTVDACCRRNSRGENAQNSRKEHRNSKRASVFFQMKSRNGREEQSCMLECLQACSGETVEHSATIVLSNVDRDDARDQHTKFVLCCHAMPLHAMTIICVLCPLTARHSCSRACQSLETLCN